MAAGNKTRKEKTRTRGQNKYNETVQHGRSKSLLTPPSRLFTKLMLEGTD